MLNLYYLREEKSLTEKAVAEAINISQAQYCKYELENSKICSNYLIILAYFYKTSIDYIVGITNEKKPYQRNNVYKNHLKELRLRKNKDIKLSGKKVGELIGISQQQYSSLERGVYNITYDKLILLAKFYNTSIDYILGLTDEEIPYQKI